MLAEARVDCIGAAAFRAGIARIIATWPAGIAALRISLVATIAAMFGAAVMTPALITASVATQTSSHQIAQ